jgi:hypothetical protein
MFYIEGIENRQMLGKDQRDKKKRRKLKLRSLARELMPFDL